MIALLLFLVFWAIAYAAPNTFRFLVLSPLVGVPTGGFFWATLCLFQSTFFSFEVFFLFLLTGTVGTGLFVWRFDT